MGVMATALALLFLFITSFCDCQSITLEARMEVVERPTITGVITFTTLSCFLMPENASVANRWILPSGGIVNQGDPGRFFVNQGIGTGVLNVVLVVNHLSYQDAGDYTCEAVDLSEPGAQWIPATVELRLIVTLQVLEREVNASTTDSEAVLRCEMTDYIRPDESLQWFREGQQITTGGRHTVVYENGTPRGAQNGGNDLVPGRVSVLTISDPVVTDSGVYACQIQGTAMSADIQLFISSAEVVDCGVPPPVDNGHFNVTATIFESMAHYDCNEDFSLSGTQSRTCQADGTWSGTDPVCEAPLNTNENLGPIIGGAVAGFLVAALVTVGIILAIILTTRRRTTTTDLNLELQSKVSNQASDPAALTHFQHTNPVNYDIEMSRNVAYISRADAIPASHNEAYGIMNAETTTTTQNEAYGAPQSGDRGENNHDYVINQLSYEEAGDQYDYVNS